jgi:hypothetical protein
MQFEPQMTQMFAESFGLQLLDDWRRVGGKGGWGGSARICVICGCLEFP